MALDKLFTTISDIASTVGNVIGPDEDGCSFGESYDEENMVCSPSGISDIQDPPVSSDVPTDVHAGRRTKENQRVKGDWRVRLSLAPHAQYLYNKAGDAGILEPLRATDGIIFPYTPRIDSVYYANYNEYDLTHSNYRGYFYQNSYVGQMLFNVTFTAQDTKEAQYMMACIHFLRSCTKMFYGQDSGNPHRGSPPPLVYLRGLGDHQFNEHACVVSLVNYNLPDDVDYIQVGRNVWADNDPFKEMGPRPSGHQSWSNKVSRLWQSGLEEGASAVGNNDVRRKRDKKHDGISMVPTKLDLSFNLLPVQSRGQVSNEFSVDKYGTGELHRRGFY